MKIALVGFRLNKGGAERVMATLSSFFEKQGIEVHLIIVLDDIAYPHSGTVFNLGKLKNQTNGLFNKFKRLVAIKNYLDFHKFDFIIDFRFRVKPLQELIMAKCVYNTKTIYTVHSSLLQDYMPNFTPLTKLIYGNSYKIVAITNAMQHSIENSHGLKNVTAIYNSVDIEIINKCAEEFIDIDFEYIIGVGEFNTTIKQFDKLIIAYSKSVLPEKNIALVILGEGLHDKYLKQLAVEHGVEDKVCFLGFKNNPYAYIKRAKFFVLSSKFEGLPMVVIESLTCGTPVVAFDCSAGLNEVVIHKENGLLIENQNIDALTAGINDMTADVDLYAHCKMNTQKSVEKFSVDRIGKQWLELMNFKFN